MNKLESTLYRSRRTLLDVCREMGLDIDTVELKELETCSSCSIWRKTRELKDDLDGNPICPECVRFYGL